MKPMSIYQASHFLGITAKALYSRCRRGTVASWKNSYGVYMIDPEELLRLQEGRAHKPRNPHVAPLPQSAREHLEVDVP